MQKGNTQIKAHESEESPKMKKATLHKTQWKPTDFPEKNN